MTEFYWQTRLWAEECPKCKTTDVLVERRRLDDDSVVDTSCVRCMMPSLLDQAEKEVRIALGEMAAAN